MTDIPPCQPFSHDTSAISRADTLTPAERYQELFVAVQMQRVFPDSKTFVDCARRHPEAILEDYRARCGEPGFDLEAFVHEHFSLYEMPVKAFVANPDDSLAEHIDRLWPILTRILRTTPNTRCCRCRTTTWCRAGASPSCTTGIPISPCSAWTSGHCDLLRAMADNFAYLIDTYGHAQRQPHLLSGPLAAAGVRPDDRALRGNRRSSRQRLPAATARNTPSGWRAPTCCARRGASTLRVWPMEWCSTASWDERATPREESYREDVETARSSRPRHEVYRDLRAGAESGWDFSSRWLDDAHRLATIRTTSILPVDLNALLLRQIAELSAVKNQRACAEAFCVQRYRLQHGQRVVEDQPVLVELVGAEVTTDAGIAPLDVEALERPALYRVGQFRLAARRHPRHQPRCGRADVAVHDGSGPECPCRRAYSATAYSTDNG